MNYRESSARLADYRRQIAEIRDKMRHAQAAAEPEEVCRIMSSRTPMVRCGFRSCLLTSRI